MDAPVSRTSLSVLSAVDEDGGWASDCTGESDSGGCLVMVLLLALCCDEELGGACASR